MPRTINQKRNAPDTKAQWSVGAIGANHLLALVAQQWERSAILVYRELTVAVFLIGHDSVTLPAVIWSYWASGATNRAAAVTLVMTLVLTPFILVFWWFGRRQLIAQSS